MKNHGASAVVAENVEKVIRAEEAIISQWSGSEKLAEDVANSVGSMYFVIATVSIMIAWIVLNCGVFPGIPIFDPYPFSMLSGITSFAAIVLFAIVLMRQNRQDVISNRREHLDLQVALLTEREVTQIVRMLDRISKHLGLADDTEADDLSQEYSKPVMVNDLVEVIYDVLPKN